MKAKPIIFKGLAFILVLIIQMCLIYYFVEAVNLVKASL